MLIALLHKWLPFIITLAVTGGILYLANWLMFRQYTNAEKKFPRQILMVVLILFALVACILALPLSEKTTIQVLSLVGLIISGLLAFSSTTIFGNLVAGIMMRFTQPFHTGDFIEVNGHFGRITERSLFDCEIQTPTRELIAIPNSVLVANAISVVRKSGTIIFADISLGYDVHHELIESLLIEAAEKTGLQEPFVHVTSLGDFSVSYKVSGLLVEVKSLLTMRSNLYRQVLDTLHNNGVEIMSPNFVNQYKLADDYRALPKQRRRSFFKEPETEVAAEDIVFDKAEEAEQKENQKAELKEQIKELEAQASEAEKEQKEKIKTQLDNLKDQLKEVDKPEKTDE